MEDFEDIVSDFDIDISVDDEEVIDVTLLTFEELVEFKEYLEQELYAKEEALNPTSQESRDKHSLRNAIQVELSRRIGS